MATSKQEQIYNEIVEYYDFADKLINLVEDSKEDVPQDQIEIIEDIVEFIEKYADQLTTQFIEFVKEGSSEETIRNTRDAINRIIFKIEKYKNKIHELQKQNIEKDSKPN